MSARKQNNLHNISAVPDIWKQFSILFQTAAIPIEFTVVSQQNKFEKLTIRLATRNQLFRKFQSLKYCVLNTELLDQHQAISLFLCPIFILMSHSDFLKLPNFSWGIRSVLWTDVKGSQKTAFLVIGVGFRSKRSFPTPCPDSTSSPANKKYYELYYIRSYCCGSMSLRFKIVMFCWFVLFKFFNIPKAWAESK